MNLYLTADQVGIESGGGIVTANEVEALKLLGPCEVWDRDRLLVGRLGAVQDPWGWDNLGQGRLAAVGVAGIEYRLAHMYAGTFSKVIDLLRQDNCKVTYTAAAHSIDDSRLAHTELGIPYDFPHLTDPEQWQRYLRGYLLADVLVCPSTHSANVMRSYGRTGPIEIIPHGCHIPQVPIQPQPDRFTVGYLGSYMPDKGVRFLLEAWKKLDYKDATLLLGGRDSISHYVQDLIAQFAFDGKCDIVAEVDSVESPKKVTRLQIRPKASGGVVECVGWVDNVGDFYNRCSLYCQPSVTEGQGIEILEAMAHGRPVIASTGAGGADVIPHTWRFAARDVNTMAFKIDMYRKYILPNADLTVQGQYWRTEAEKYTWPKIKERYVAMWQKLLKGE